MMAKMNSNGQTLVLFVVIMPILSIMFIFLFQLGSINLDKKKVTDTIKEALNYGVNNLDSELLVTNVKNMIIIPIVIYVKENKYKYGKTMKKCFQITTYDNHILELKYNLMNLSRFLKQPKMRNTILEELIYIEN